MTMYRFLLKPKWVIFTLAVGLAVVLMISLGFWQIRRLDERRDFNTFVAQRSAMPATSPLEGWIGPDADPETAEWRQVALVGTFEGRTDTLPVSGGYQLISPMTLNDGTTVLINRGGTDVTATITAPPQGTVELIGRVRRVPSVLRRAEGLTGTYVEAISSDPADGGATALEVPALTEGQHLSYSLQWFTFAGCVIVGWVMAVRRTARPQQARRGRRSKHQAIPWRDDPV